MCEERWLSPLLSLLPLLCGKRGEHASLSGRAARSAVSPPALPHPPAKARVGVQQAASPLASGLSRH